MGADTCCLCTMVTPRISCAPQPSPSRHRRSRSKDAEAFQGALDGGLGIPHSDKRFAGFKKDKKQPGAEIHRKYIYEGHVADYMKVSWIHCPRGIIMPFLHSLGLSLLYT
ncbi:hypothetical protein VPH35_067395 [Triticum aestivum]|uniref:uncharacterized protein n=1 Tax=Triticum aestivum TaxID=4565 RepID=UPI001D024667|nr:uncharacterized protein LOC123082368 [Triticum aestivum]